jgi:hypothetical protein
VKRALLLQILLGALLIAGYSANANASAFMTLSVGGPIFSCDNSSPFTLTNCGNMDWQTVPNGSSITWVGGTVSGYLVNAALTGSVSGQIQLVSTVDHVTAPSIPILQIDFGVNGLTAPIGIQTLSATHSGSIDVGVFGSENFQGWERNDNTLTPGPTGATAVSTTFPCTFVGLTCTGPTATFGGPNVTAPFALTGQAMINTLIGSQTAFTDTVALTPAPEPNTLVLLATGMLLVAGTVRTRK